jgi:cysteine-rich repeat protein
VITKYALVIKYVDIVCGDTMVGFGEQCDDGNTTSGDGCDSTCQIEPFCGDGILQPAEWCDDSNMAAGDGCSATCQIEGAVTEVEPNDDGSTSTSSNSSTGNDFGSANPDANGAFTTSARIAARIRAAGDEDVFAFRNPSTTAAVTAQFDVWNNAAGFGIGVSCGSSIDTMMHLRDAAGTSLANNDQRVSGDGCSKITFGILPGQTVYAHVFDYGDTDVIASYTLDVVFTPVPCGDGVIGTGEQCDDSNLAAGDGCSSTCQLENAVTEVEPNDDGTVATGATGITGNDFSSAAANGPFTTSKRVLAKLAVAGDEDVFAFTNPLTGPVQVRFDIWNLAVGKGFGVPCAATINPGLNIRNAAGTVLLNNDDRNGATDRCSGLTFTMTAGQTVYAHVVDESDNTAIASYVLDVTYAPVICGDTIVGPTEQCDDGNAMDGDGCSATCQWELICGNGMVQAGEQCDDANSANNDGCSSTCMIENQVTEGEPNNNGSDADANTVQISGNAFVAGAITPAGDVDRYKVTVATATTVRFETFTAWGDCSTATLDLRLFDSGGSPIVSDLAGSGINECGAIVMFLAAGTYYVQVEERGNNATVASYRLQVAFQTDGGTETEPNETTLQASANLVSVNETFVFGDHMMTDDVDVYAITVPPNGRLRAEVIEGNRQTEACESGGVDSRLMLYDDAGTLLTEDNDTGRGLCSLIDGTGTTPLDPTSRNTSSTMAKTYYLVVGRSPLASTTGGQFVYRLQVTVR